MFSGIVQATGTVRGMERRGDNINITIEAPFTEQLHIDQSVAHNGVCLTVVNIDGDRYTVTAIRETLDKSNLGLLAVGDKVNLERSMSLDALLDGHIVQGHVDTTARCRAIEQAQGSWYYTFEYTPNPQQAGYTTVEKGSVAVNGVSLTVVNSIEGDGAKPSSFQVAIIPYTHEHTNFHTFEVGSTVNLEFDIIGKYVARMMGPMIAARS